MNLIQDMEKTILTSELTIHFTDLTL
jgi:hypothetical protein